MPPRSAKLDRLGEVLRPMEKRGDFAVPAAGIDKELIRKQATAPYRSPARRREDTEATWTRQAGQVVFGYKVSVSADPRYKRMVSTAPGDVTRPWRRSWTSPTPSVTSTA